MKPLLKVITYRGGLKDPSLKKLNWYNGTIKHLSSEDDFIFEVTDDCLIQVEYIRENNNLEFLKIQNERNIF